MPLVTAPVLEKKWSDMNEDERWIAPGDWEIQKGQGPITLHSEERLAGSDTGVAMLRRRLREEIRRVQNGEDPVGRPLRPVNAAAPHRRRQLLSRSGPGGVSPGVFLLARPNVGKPEAGPSYSM